MGVNPRTRSKEYTNLKVHRSTREQLSVADGAKMIFVTFLWALCFPLIRAGLASGTSPILFGALRSAIAALGLAAVAHFRNESISRAKVHLFLLLMIGVAAFFGYAGMFLGGSSVDPGLASVISNSSPIFASVLAAIFLAESLSRRKIAGLLLGSLGVAVISIPAFSAGSSSSLFGIGFVLVAALGTAVGNVLLKKISNSGFPVLALVVQFAFAAFLLLPVSLIFEVRPAVRWSLNFSLSLAALSLGGSALADILWIDLLKTNSLSKLNVFVFLTPVFSSIMGVAFFHESFGFWEILGILAIVGGVFLILERMEREPRAHAGRASTRRP